MSDHPIDLRGEILRELERSRDLVSRGNRIAPRFEIFAPDGRHSMRIASFNEHEKQRKAFAIVRLFMIWKAASAFTLAVEVSDPEAISVLGISRIEALGAVEGMNRELLVFGEAVWFGRESIGDDVLALLPPKMMTISQEELTLMRTAFEDLKLFDLR